MNILRTLFDSLDRRCSGKSQGRQVQGGVRGEPGQLDRRGHRVRRGTVGPYEFWSRIDVKDWMKEIKFLGASHYPVLGFRKSVSHPVFCRSPCQAGWLTKPEWSVKKMLFARSVTLNQFLDRQIVHVHRLQCQQQLRALNYIIRCPSIFGVEDAGAGDNCCFSCTITCAAISTISLGLFC